VVGWIGKAEGKPRWGARPVRVELQGLSLWRVELWLPEGTGQRALSRRLRRAGRQLIRLGVRRILAFPGCPEEALRNLGLREVEVLPFLQAMAPRLILARLEGLGIPPERATVLLRGVQTDRALEAAAWALCPAVRQLIIQAPPGGERLGAALRREFGMPLVDHWGRPDVTAVFSGGCRQGGELGICAPRPQLCGLELGLDWQTPEDCQALSLLALLWETGRLDLRRVRFFYPPGP
jgi:hypothetical protein